MIPGTKLHVTVLTQLKQLPLRGIRISTSRPKTGITSKEDTPRIVSLLPVTCYLRYDGNM